MNPPRPRVLLIGRPEIRFAGGGPEGEVAQPRGRKSWALLARIAMAERPLLRRELADELFDQADDPFAALRWSLADLRRSLALPDLLRGDPLSLDPALLDIDVWELEAGASTIACLRGELLDGASPADTPAFDSWLLLARAHCGRRCRELSRETALRCLVAGDVDGATAAAELGAHLDPLGEDAQELLLRVLVAAGRIGDAAACLTECRRRFARAGLPLPPAFATAATQRSVRPPSGVRAGVAAAALLRAGTAALDAGAADAGVETLRRAADDAERAGDAALQSEVQLALGRALVHAVRGADGEGAIVLRRSLRAAEEAGRPLLAAEVLRELAFVDVQAGRHHSAARALCAAAERPGAGDDAALRARLLAVEGMNEADLGHHLPAVDLLTRSAEIAGSAGQVRQRIWSLGVLSRSLLLLDRVDQSRAAAEASIAGASAERWHAFLPWPQALRAECAARQGDWATAARDAEESFALGCELGDPCWEGMAARALSLIAAHDGDGDAAWRWSLDARARCDRVSDRYVWISGYIGLAQIDLAWLNAPEQVPGLAARLHADAVRTDLPEFQAWALLHLARSGEAQAADRAVLAARSVDSPALHRELLALAGSRSSAV